MPLFDNVHVVLLLHLVASSVLGHIREQPERSPREGVVYAALQDKAEVPPTIDKAVILRMKEGARVGHGTEDTKTGYPPTGERWS